MALRETDIQIVQSALLGAIDMVGKKLQSSTSKDERAEALEEINVLMRTRPDGNESASLEQYTNKSQATRPFLSLFSWTPDTSLPEIRNELRLILWNTDPSISTELVSRPELRDLSTPTSDRSTITHLLTEKETVIFNFAVTGRTPKETARELGVTITTVHNHRRFIRAKLHASSITQAVADELRRREAENLQPAPQS